MHGRNADAGFRIGGFEPLSLNDYPGHIAAVVFTQGCNFRCPFCHNGGLIPVPNANNDTTAALTRSSLLDELGRRRRLIDGLVVTGGEPTLQPGLADLLADVKAIGLAVKLDTNGSRPEVLEALLHDRLVDMIAMDIKAPWDQYDRLVGGPVSMPAVRRSMMLIAQSGLPHQFRTTVVPALLDAAALRAIRAQIPANSPYALQPFVAEHCLDPALKSVGVREHIPA